MQEIKLDTMMYGHQASALVNYLETHFKEQALHFKFKPVGTSGNAFQIWARGPQADQLRDQLFYWCGYYYAQIASIRTAT